MPTKKSKFSLNPPTRKARKALLGGVSRPFGAPVALGYQKPQPRFISKPPVLPGACVCYEGCDFVSNVSSSSSAASTGSLSTLAPFNSNAFPRLYGIADLFLRYQFKKLVYHFIGKSASTQAGVGAFCSFVLDGATTTITVNTEAIVKNAEGALVLKGWESGNHVVNVAAAGPRWYNCDVDSVPFSPGNLVYYLPQTTANGDLAWDLYVEYEVEFAEPVAGATVTPLMRERKQRKLDELNRDFGKPKPDVPDIEDLDKEIVNLRLKICDLEKQKTSPRTPT